MTLTLSREDPSCSQADSKEWHLSPVSNKADLTCTVSTLPPHTHTSECEAL